MYEKPLMRGLHIRYVKKQLLIGAGVVLLTGALCVEYFIKPRQRIYIDYYKDFDPEVSLNYMNSKGWMRSCPQDDD
ncbi:cytochrome c oxidase subunit 6C-like [Leptopilina boulardi]|uniref:cytochrome c oxidase subunit 6C-like n=1 Tax=Leptopilina boulardi TaxID=63433 RepID=UPI0021F5163D|nr:cytochrome c oxidase subunit 6C-like [Leptopilina boulardi]